MRNNRAAKKPFAVFILALLLAFSTSGFILFDDTFFEVARGIELFTKVYKEITFNYVDEISPAEFLIAGIRGMLATLDPYTIYMDEKKQEDIDLLTTGKYGGIGVMIGLRESKITILEILDGYSAQKQGLQVGDIILNVDGQTVNEKNFDRISSLVKGEAGSFVRLLINRGAVTDTLRFELLREEIKVKNVAFADFIDSSR
jgi:carboxyl-terminal processing protease